MGSVGGSGGIVGSVPLMGASGPYGIGPRPACPGGAGVALWSLSDGALRCPVCCRDEWGFGVFRVVFRRVSRCFPLLFAYLTGLCVVLRVGHCVFPRAVGFRVAYGVPRGFVLFLVLRFLVRALVKIGTPFYLRFCNLIFVI